MTIQQVVFPVLIVGAALGVALIGAVILVYYRKQTLDRGGTLMIFGGIILFGLSAWQSFEFKAGQVSLKATSALVDNLGKAIEINKSRVQTIPPSSGSCEEDRKKLRLNLQNEIDKRKQLDEELNNVYRALAHQQDVYEQRFRDGLEGPKRNIR
jgi:hypothetical protein